jgi:hypothetical protein
MNAAVFFITTARSGTQWVAAALARHFSHSLVVAHEPVGYAYRPKVYLRADDRVDELRAQPRVARHLDGIHRILRTTSYVEVGFPCFALAPLLLREFGDRLRIVQLVRHPVRVAASAVTHRWYQKTRSDSLPQDVELAPTDPGVLQKHYADRWRSMSAYEKALFYWSEVHQFAQEVKARLTTVPFHTARFEDLILNQTARENFAEFVGVQSEHRWENFVKTRVDHFHLRTAERIDLASTTRHPKVLEMSARYGYDLASVSVKSIRSRYEDPSEHRVLKRVKNRIERIARDTNLRNE